MPRTTKKTTTPIEKQTIPTVPAAEQPYKVPENWRWVRLGDVCIFENGYAFKSQYFSPENGVPVIRISDITDNEVNLNNTVKTTETNVDDRFVVYFGDLLIAMSGATTGKNGIYYSTEKAFLNQRVGNIKINQYKYIISKYRNYLILNKTDEILRNAYGGAQPNISSKKICMMPIPLPPLAEQQRIVDRIERLFAKLDEAREKAQAVVDGFENRKAAILHQAFTGELTRKWREENNIIEIRRSRSIDSVCHSLKYGTAKKSKPVGDVVVIRMGNLQDGEIDWTNLVYSDDEEDNRKYLLKQGDVLFNRTNSPDWVGKTSIYRGEAPAIYAGYLIKMDYNHDIIIGEYLNYILNSPEAKEYCNTVKTDGVNQSNINAKKIGAFTIPLPSMNEQTEIVRIINNMIIKLQRARDLAESVIAQIDGMKKSILARAFRGELGTNDPSEAGV